VRRRHRRIQRDGAAQARLGLPPVAVVEGLHRVRVRRERARARGDRQRKVGDRSRPRGSGRRCRRRGHGPWPHPHGGDSDGQRGAPRGSLSGLRTFLEDRPDRLRSPLARADLRSLTAIVPLTNETTRSFFEQHFRPFSLKPSSPTQPTARRGLARHRSMP
jgi:hypothetical protein